MDCETLDNRATAMSLHLKKKREQMHLEMTIALIIERYVIQNYIKGVMSWVIICSRGTNEAF